MFFKIPTEVYIENNVIENNKNRISKYGKNALIVTGRSSSKHNGSLNDIIDCLKELDINYYIYDKIEENPLTKTIIDASVIGIKMNVDFIIGVGGGSSIDASKAIGLMIKNKNLNESFLYEKNDDIKSLPIIAIPTTCGTGSEVTGVAVLSVESKKTKVAMANKIFPSLALLDIKYLKTLPLNILRNTSIDALAHLYESYINKNATIISKGIVIEGLRIWRRCKNALLTGNINDIDYLNLLTSSMLAGMAIAHTGTSLAHGLSYLVTYETGIPHGKAVGYYLAEYIKRANNTEEILLESGFKDVNDLNEFLNEVLGEFNISNDILKRSAIDLFNNKDKLKSCPYEIDIFDLYEISKLGK